MIDCENFVLVLGLLKLKYFHQLIVRLFLFYVPNLCNVLIVFLFFLELSVPSLDTYYYKKLLFEVLHIRILVVVRLLMVLLINIIRRNVPTPHYDWQRMLVVDLDKN